MVVGREEQADPFLPGGGSVALQERWRSLAPGRGAAYMCWVQLQGETGPSPCSEESKWERPRPGKARSPWGEAACSPAFSAKEKVSFLRREGIEWEMVTRGSGQLEPLDVN